MIEMVIRKKDRTETIEQVKLPKWLDDLITKKWFLYLFAAVMVVLVVGSTLPANTRAELINSVFAKGPTEGPGPPSGDAGKIPPIVTGTATPTPTGQEKINTAGIAVSLAGVDFDQAEEWKLNTLYISPERPGYGTLLVRMKDVEHLQPFRIANAEYSNFRFEKHEKDVRGFIARFEADAVTPKGNVGARLWVQVFDKLPQKNKDGVIVNGAITLFTSGMDFENLPPSNSVLRIKVTQ